MGCLVGAMVGDSCGSLYQFTDRMLCDEEMNLCMTIPGGGPFKLNSGQITDDTELGLCLMHALSNPTDQNMFDLDAVIESYRKWANSDPFDVEENVVDTLMKLQD